MQKENEETNQEKETKTKTNKQTSMRIAEKLRGQRKEKYSEVRITLTELIII